MCSILRFPVVCYGLWPVKHQEICICGFFKIILLFSSKNWQDSPRYVGKFQCLLCLGQWNPLHPASIPLLSPISLCSFTLCSEATCFSCISGNGTCFPVTVWLYYSSFLARTHFFYTFHVFLPGFLLFFRLTWPWMDSSLEFLQNHLTHHVLFILIYFSIYRCIYLLIIYFLCINLLLTYYPFCLSSIQYGNEW